MGVGVVIVCITKRGIFMNNRLWYNIGNFCGVVGGG